MARRRNRRRRPTTKRRAVGARVAPTDVAELPGTGCYAHPHMAMLADAGVTAHMDLLKALQNWVQRAPRSDAEPVRVSVALGLWGSAAMSRICYAPDVDLTMQAHFAFTARMGTQIAAQRTVVRLLLPLLRTLVAGAQEHAGVKFLALETEWSNALAVATRKPIGLKQTWSAADLERGVLPTPQGQMPIETSLLYTALPKLLFVTTERRPRLCDLCIDVSFLDPAGVCELGAGPPSLWFAHVSPDRAHARISSGLEAQLARVFRDRYDPLRAFPRSQSVAIENAARSGNAFKILKRLAAVHAFAGRAMTVSEIAEWLRSPWGRIDAQAAYVTAVAKLANGDALPEEHWRRAAEETLVEIREALDEVRVADDPSAGALQSGLDAALAASGVPAGDWSTITKLAHDLSCAANQWALSGLHAHPDWLQQPYGHAFDALLSAR